MHVLCRLKSVGRTSDRLLDLSSHSLNVSVNSFVSIEAILSPTDDSQLVVHFLQLLRSSQVPYTQSSFLNFVNDLYTALALETCHFSSERFMS